MLFKIRLPILHCRRKADVAARSRLLRLALIANVFVDTSDAGTHHRLLGGTSTLYGRMGVFLLVIPFISLLFCLHWFYIYHPFSPLQLLHSPYRLSKSPTYIACTPVSCTKHREYSRFELLCPLLIRDCLEKEIYRARNEMILIVRTTYPIPTYPSNDFSCQDIFRRAI